MQVKAQGLLNAAKWIEEEYGRDALRDVLHSCSQEVRERYMTAEELAISRSTPSSQLAPAAA